MIEDYLPTVMWDPDADGCTFVTRLPDDTREPIPYCGRPVDYLMTQTSPDGGMVFGACAAHTAWIRRNRGDIVESVWSAA